MSIPSPEPLYYNAFNQVPQIGPVRFQKLLNFFPNLETAWTATVSELMSAGLEEAVAGELLSARKRINPEVEWDKLTTAGIDVITIHDEAYPELLREIPSAPVVLYLKGKLIPEDRSAIAVVGTRKMSSYGRQVAQDLVAGLASLRITVISGLALGIDAIAHQAAIEQAGRTVAILACGVDSIYPSSNRQIAEQIQKGRGAVISELPLGTPPLKHHFVYRNRIISGMALGTVVIEAAADSGALITARHALEQNRQVYAVPGSIYNPCSVGPNNLLKMGAKPVTNATDILEDLNLGHLAEQLETEAIIGDNKEEDILLKLLTREPQHFDILAKTSGLPASTVAATLTIMEMKGKVRNLGANQYVLSR